MPDRTVPTDAGPLRVAIIGAGLQGRRRAQALHGWPTARLAVVASLTCAHAERLAGEYGGRVAGSWAEAVQAPEVDAVLVCTPPDSHAEIALAAIARGKHVLCEKPMARTSADAARIVTAAAAAGVVATCGFNHRFHPAVTGIRRLLEAGTLGPAYFLRCAYGIAGRPGYEREWRCDPAVVAGGHLVEQGIHAVDLAGWLLGPVRAVTAACATQHWPITPLEDNAMVLLRFASGAIGSIHASLTQWVNTFRLEIGGADGLAVAEGLGGGYGEERLTVWRRTEGPFTSEVTAYRGADQSWRLELAAFERLVRAGAEAPAGEHPGVSSLAIVEKAYRASQEQTWLPI